MKYLIYRMTKEGFPIIEHFTDSLEKAQNIVREDALRGIRFTSRLVDGQTVYTMERPSTDLQIILLRGILSA